MKPPTPLSISPGDLFRSRLDNQLDLSHGLLRAGAVIPWSRFEDEFGALYCQTNGAPGKAIQLMVGLQLIKHMYGLSDEAVVQGWRENAYWQYFCGEEYLQTSLPIDPSSMTRFRKRIGTAGCEKILAGMIEAGVRSKAVTVRQLERVTLDTTVQDKAVSYPTDGKLLNRARQRLVKWCRKHDLVKLRQSYVRVGPKLLLKVNRYAHARQFNKMRAGISKLHTILGRVVRDIEGKVVELPEELQRELKLAKRLLKQQKEDKNKLYSMHAPEVECISKGKAHKRYEFGVKVSIAVTNASNFVVGAMALPGNPYDGHTLKAALEQVRRLSGREVTEAYVDRGYRGHGETQTKVYISGQKRGVTNRIKRCLKRRQAIEPVIGHLKYDGLLGRNYLQGRHGDEMNVVLVAAGHNLRLVVAKVEVFLRLFYVLYRWLWVTTGLPTCRSEHLRHPVPLLSSR